MITFEPPQNPARYQGPLFYFTDAEAERPSWDNPRGGLGCGRASCKHHLQPSGQLRTVQFLIATLPIRREKWSKSAENGAGEWQKWNLSSRLTGLLQGRGNKSCSLPQAIPSPLYLASLEGFLASSRCKPTPPEPCKDHTGNTSLKVLRQISPWVPGRAETVPRQNVSGGSWWAMSHGEQYSGMCLKHVINVHTIQRHGAKRSTSFIQSVSKTKKAHVSAELWTGSLRWPRHSSVFSDFLFPIREIQALCQIWTTGFYRDSTVQNIRKSGYDQ